MIDGLRSVDLPNGRRLLHLDGPRRGWPALLQQAMADSDRDLVVTIDEQDTEARSLLGRAGFSVTRVEVSYRAQIATLAVGPGEPVPAVGVELISALDADLGRLQLLDEAIRDNIPGSRGWQWAARDFRDQTFSPGFDPETYLVAVDRCSGDYVGLIRVWMRSAGPRLGCIGVVRTHRRTRVTATLLSAVLSVLGARGHGDLVFEISEDNAESLAMLRHADVQAVGRSVEMLRAQPR